MLCIQPPFTENERSGYKALNLKEGFSEETLERRTNRLSLAERSSMRGSSQGCGPNHLLYAQNQCNSLFFKHYTDVFKAKK